jgi:hypothetical protein
VVCDAHVFLLQFHVGSFVANWQGEMALLFSVWQGREAFHGLRVQDVVV